MRIPKKQLPEGIKSEVDRVLGTFYTTEGSAASPELQRAKQMALKRYYSARGIAIAGWCIYPVAVLTAMVGIKAGAGLSPAWAFFPGLAGIVPLHFAFPSSHGYTPEELRAYLPLMSLSPAETAYIEALTEAYSPGADEALRSEVIPAMRRLVEESIRLDRLEAQLAEGGSNSVKAEVDQMRARLQTLEDQSAREALSHGIAIAERRLNSAISESAASERIEAHRAMIRQAALAARDTVRRLRLSPDSAPMTSDLDLSALRASADDAGREVAALEAAVQEMRAL